MLPKIELGRALSLVVNAVEVQARFLAGKYKRYNEAEELRIAMKKLKKIAIDKTITKLISS